MSLRNVAVLFVALAACGPAPAPQTVDSAIASPQRSPANRARDAYRHPKETLELFGVTKDKHVLELWPGGGWYTEILAPLLRGSGKLTITATDATPPRFPNVDIVRIAPPAQLSLGADESEDIVLTFRNVHNWIQGGFEKQIFVAVFKVLKHGGTFGVVDHRADPGTDDKTIKETGYVPEQLVLDLAQAAGFKLDAKSEINANPKDDHKHPGGVWALPPVLTNGEKDKATYLAIGESDRMTLRFTKP